MRRALRFGTVLKWAVIVLLAYLEWSWDAPANAQPPPAVPSTALERGNSARPAGSVVIPPGY